MAESDAAAEKDPVNVGNDGKGERVTDAVKLRSELAVSDTVACEADADAVGSEALAAADCDAETDATEPLAEGDIVDEKVASDAEEVGVGDAHELGVALDDARSDELVEIDERADADKDDDVDGESDGLAEAELERESCELLEDVAVKDGDCEWAALRDVLPVDDGDRELAASTVAAGDAVVESVLVGDAVMRSEPEPLAVDVAVGEDTDVALVEADAGREGVGDAESTAEGVAVAVPHVVSESAALLEARNVAVGEPVSPLLPLALAEAVGEGVACADNDCAGLRDADGHADALLLTLLLAHALGEALSWERTDAEPSDEAVADAKREGELERTDDGDVDTVTHDDEVSDAQDDNEPDARGERDTLGLALALSDCPDALAFAEREFDPDALALNVGVGDALASPGESLGVALGVREAQLDAVLLKLGALETESVVAVEAVLDKHCDAVTEGLNDPVALADRSVDGKPDALPEGDNACEYVAAWVLEGHCDPDSDALVVELHMRVVDAAPLGVPEPVAIALTDAVRDGEELALGVPLEVRDARGDALALVERLVDGVVREERDSEIEALDDAVALEDGGAEEVAVLHALVERDTERV